MICLPGDPSTKVLGYFHLVRCADDNYQTFGQKSMGGSEISAEDHLGVEASHETQDVNFFPATASSISQFRRRSEIASNIWHLNLICRSRSTCQRAGAPSRSGYTFPE